MAECIINVYEIERGLTQLLVDIHCTAPGKFRKFGKKICGVTGAMPKITQRMAGKIPLEGWTTQPMHLCKAHWDKYPEINALDGYEKPKRPFPK